MSELKEYLMTFISDSDAVDICLVLIVLLVVMSILRVLGFGLFKS